MRLMQTFSFYDVYLGGFCRARPWLNDCSFNEIIDELLRDGFAAGQILVNDLPPLGYETFLAVANFRTAQSKWAAENGFAPPQSPQEELALLARQVETFRPDVLYLGDPIRTDARWLASLSFRPRFVLGWRQAEIPDGVDWRGVDLMLSGDAGYRRRAAALGAKDVADYWPGFPRRLAEAVKDVPKDCDAAFTGQLTRDHAARSRMLRRLAQAAGGDSGRRFDLALYLSTAEPPPPLLAAFDRGARWGLDMYKALRGGRICVNAHIDLTAAGVNFRILETTGVGSFLLTEAAPGLEARFVPGREIETYADLDEMTEKIAYYLDRPAEREEIARRGQERCLRDHSMEARAVRFDAIIRERFPGGI